MLSGLWLPLHARILLVLKEAEGEIAQSVLGSGPDTEVWGGGSLDRARLCLGVGVTVEPACVGFQKVGKAGAPGRWEM